MLRKTIRSVDQPKYRHLYDITDLRLYSSDKEKIYLEFKPMDIGEDGKADWEDFHRYDSLMIFQTDYERLLSPLMDKLYPLKELESGEIQDSLDYCFENFIGSEDRQRFTEMIREKAVSSEGEEKDFFSEMLVFLENAGRQSEYFCIEGNL